MTIFWEALLGALMLCGKLVLIVVPLVVVFEVLRYAKVFRTLGSRTEPVMRGLGLGRSAILPLFTGIFLGIAYGAGIIIISTSVVLLRAVIIIFDTSIVIAPQSH